MQRENGHIRLTVNGEERTLPPEAGLVDVLTALGLDPEAATGVAVAVNDEVVRRRAWRERTLREGDRVEVITARQGG